MRILKFGGKSLASPEKTQNICKNIKKIYKKDKNIIIIVSAIGNSTDSLLALAEKYAPETNQKNELAKLLSTGEIVSRSEIEILLKKHPNTLFVVDCTYINFAQDIALEDYIDLIKEYENIAVVKSYSKDFHIHRMPHHQFQ